jgi:hypothetical protein
LATPTSARIAISTSMDSTAPERECDRLGVS